MVYIDNNDTKDIEKEQQEITVNYLGPEALFNQIVPVLFYNCSPKSLIMPTDNAVTDSQTRDRTMNNQPSLVDRITARPELLLIISLIGLFSSLVVGVVTGDMSLMNVPLVVTMLVLAISSMFIALSGLNRSDI